MAYRGKAQAIAHRINCKPKAHTGYKQIRAYNQIMNYASETIAFNINTHILTSPPRPSPIAQPYNEKVVRITSKKLNQNRS